MASKPLQSSRMELYEPSLTKPNPLRIVKHPKAQSHGSPTRIIPQNVGRLTGPPDSPPDPPERQLTIPKLRKKRASILENTDEGHTGSVILAMVQKRASPCRGEDSGRTARPSQKGTRVASIGNYVKEELLKGSLDSEPHPSFESDRSSDTVEHESLTLARAPSAQGLKTSESSFSLYSEADTENSLTPKRQLSRSRRFLQKAIGGLDGARSKSMHILRSESFSKDSKDSLIRKVSLKNHRAALSSSSVGFHSVASNSSFDLDFTRTKYRRDPIPNFDCFPERTVARTRTLETIQNELLVPKISVLQGSHNIADGDENAVWVAIEVTGACVKIPANEQTDARREYYNSRNDSISLEPSNSNDTKEQDYLYDMKVDIRANDGCTVESVIGDIEEPRSIRNKQSELLIVKIRFMDNFTKATSSPGHVRQSSETLIAELESRLIECNTDFIDVTLTYKHSAFRFLEHLTTKSSSSTAHQNTKLITEARAIIKRNDSLAAWGPRAPDHDNPLSDLIRSHFASDRAEGIIQRISSRPQPRVTELPAMLQRNASWSSSEGTITPTQGRKKFQHSLLTSPTTQDKSARIAPLKLPTSYSSNKSSEYSTPDTSTRELDPARKIWSEMRRTSKGTRSACIKTLTDGFSADDGYMNLERQRIQEQAVRNKRSLGADTLRSIVGEREGERGRTKQEMQGGRVGGWVGWGPPWW